MTRAPDQRIMTGPNLPQNWIRDIRPGEIAPRRTEVIQFPESFIENAVDAFPEMTRVRSLLERSRCGLLFGSATGRAIRPPMGKRIGAHGVRRLALFFETLDLLVNAPQQQRLASLSVLLDMERAEESGINRAIAHLRAHLTAPLSEPELAGLTGQSQSAFSRSFRRHTGTTLVRYRNQLRIDRACQMLLSDPGSKVADIGLATAKALLAAGAKVVMVDRDEAALIELIPRLGGNAIPQVTDFLDTDSCDAMVPEILKMTGQIDILYCNAGSYIAAIWPTPTPPPSTGCSI